MHIQYIYILCNCYCYSTEYFFWVSQLLLFLWQTNGQRLVSSPFQWFIGLVETHMFEGKNRRKKKTHHVSGREFSLKLSESISHHQSIQSISSSTNVVKRRIWTAQFIRPCTAQIFGPHRGWKFGEFLSPLAGHMPRRAVGSENGWNLLNVSLNVSWM